MSTNAVYCGTTASTTGAFSTTIIPGFGNVSGYRSGKALCELACGSPAAHMCSNEELGRSAQMGALPQVAAGYWFAGMAYSQYNSSNSIDCDGWTSGAPTLLGAFVVADFGGPSSTFRVTPNIDWCNNSHRIICCL
jgi:hypothetical protein